MNRNRIASAAALLVVGLVAGAALAQPAVPPGAAATAPLADKLPAQSIAYLGWGGVGPNKAALEKTGLGQLLNDPEVKPYVDQIWAQLEAFLKGQADKNLPPGAYDPIRSLILDVVVDRPWAISLVDVTIPGLLGPSPAENPGKTLSAVLLADLGDKADQAAGNIDTLLGKLLPPKVRKQIKEIEIGGAAFKSLFPLAKDAPEIIWGATKGHLIVACNRPAVETVVALITGRSGESLAGNPQFAKVLAKTGLPSGGIGYFYVDLARVRKQFLPMIVDKAADGGNKNGATISKVVTALGGDAIDAFGACLRLDGQEFISQSYLLAPRGKPGLLTLFDQKPLSPDLLATVPADASFAMLLNVNRPRLLAKFDKQIAKFPEAKAKVDQFRKPVEDAIGMSLEDLAQAAGDGVAIYNSPSAGGFLFTGLTVVAEVKDAAKIRAALPKIEQAILKQFSSSHAPKINASAFLMNVDANNVEKVELGSDGTITGQFRTTEGMNAGAAKEFTTEYNATDYKDLVAKLQTHNVEFKFSNDLSAQPSAPISFKSGKFKDYEYRYLATAGVPMPFAPAWCLTDKYLVVSMFPQTLKAALLKIEAGRKGSLLDNDWLARQLAGPAKGATMLSYSDDRQMMRIIYPLLLPGWEMACSMADNMGVSLDVNALPRQDLLLKYVGDSYGAAVPDDDGVLFVGRNSVSGSSLVGSIYVTGMMTAILLPSLGQGMEAGRKAQSANNLRGLANVLRIFEQKNNRYPDSLDELVKEGFCARKC